MGSDSPGFMLNPRQSPGTSPASVPSAKSNRPTTLVASHPATQCSIEFGTPPLMAFVPHFARITSAQFLWTEETESHGQAMPIPPRQPPSSPFQTMISFEKILKTRPNRTMASAAILLSGSSVYWTTTDTPATLQHSINSPQMPPKNSTQPTKSLARIQTSDSTGGTIG